MSEFVKIVVFAPLSHAGVVREAMSNAGAGNIGNYDSCSFSARGTGRFRGLPGTQPFIGESGKVEEVEEEKIETICAQEIAQNVIDAVIAVHPYEEPAIDVYPLLNHKYNLKKPHGN